MTRILLSSLLLLSLAACGSEPSGKTATKLDAVEVQPGTISDSMIILDDAASDGTAVDNSVPDDGVKKDVAKPEEAASPEAGDDEDSGDESPDAVDIPVARKSITADDTTKKSE